MSDFDASFVKGTRHEADGNSPLFGSSHRTGPPVCACPGPRAGAQTTAAISEVDAPDIAVDAYLYFYPLVTMDLTRKQLINARPGRGVVDQQTIEGRDIA